MDLGAAGWGLQTIIGAALFAAVLLWAVLRNRSSRRVREESERGTRDVYDRSEEVRRDGEDDGA
jgi:hypothetical protein